MLNMKTAQLSSSLVIACLAACAAQPAAESAAVQSPAPPPSEAPLLPGGKWQVHDEGRPAPTVVTPGVGAQPPSDAVVLFDGRGADAWTGAEGGLAWAVQDGALVAGGGNVATREAFGDCQLHIEWATPAAGTGEGQARGNSGVFFMGRYEVQVLDSFQNATYPDGQAAALYGQEPPLVNACRPPGEWQSYDIVFRA